MFGKNDCQVTVGNGDGDRDGDGAGAREDPYVARLLLATMNQHH